MSDDVTAGTGADSWDVDTWDADAYHANAAYEALLYPVLLEGSPPGLATSLSFVAQMKLKDQVVNIESGNLLQLATEGISFTLVQTSPPTELGSLRNLVEWFCDQMNLDYPDWDNLPAALQAITSAVATIDKLFVKASKSSVQFDIAVSLDFKDGWTIIGNLKMQRFTFRLARLQPGS